MRIIKKLKGYRFTCPSCQEILYMIDTLQRKGEIDYIRGIL